LLVLLRADYNQTYDGDTRIDRVIARDRVIGKARARRRFAQMSADRKELPGLPKIAELENRKPLTPEDTRSTPPFRKLRVAQGRLRNTEEEPRATDQRQKSAHF
jgi:hypothetical protein